MELLLVRLFALLFLTLLKASYEADPSSQAPDRFEKLVAKRQIQANAPVQASSQIVWNLQPRQGGSTLVKTNEYRPDREWRKHAQERSYREADMTGSGPCIAR